MDYNASFFSCDINMAGSEVKRFVEEVDKLYDGLTVVNSTPRVIENIKKDICRIFNNNGLRITIEANKKIINFLDTTFNLNQCTYQPYTKPNTTIKYVHHDSNHPPSTIKKIYLPASTDVYPLYLPTKHPLIKQPHHTKKP